MRLNKYEIKNELVWRQVDIELPGFDLEQMILNTQKRPAWIHFGTGNIFRGFVAVLQQSLLNIKKADTGIIAVVNRDMDILDKVLKSHDNLTLLVHMNADGTLEKKVVASIAESLLGDSSRENDWKRLKTIFSQPSLQMVSLTITEKGYRLTDMSGDYLPDVKHDIEHGPEKPKNIISKIASLAYIRYLSGELPIAFVSMDNCSHNGEVLYNAIYEISEKWIEKGFVENDFLGYIDNPLKVSFPWTMIDKITPGPSEKVKEYLEEIEFESAGIIQTNNKTLAAAFVNGEASQHLVIEDSFPNGRMPLELAGVIFTDRQTVELVEKMKVCTCLNPLHTSLAIFGCLLGYRLIADEMKDKDLRRLVEKIAYDEAMPVVANPGIIEPKDFINEVINIRLPNNYIADTPQRIASDTSQKMPIRFGETIKTYCNHSHLNVKNLVFIPFVIAGWCRYLLGVDDLGEKMELSPDPMMDELKLYIKDIKLGNEASVGDSLKPILSNEKLFKVNLYSVGLGEKIEGYFKEMISGKNAVRNVLQKYLK